MPTTPKKYLFLYAMLLTALVFASSVFAQEFIYNAPPNTSVSPTPSPISLLTKVEAAKNLLRSSAPLVVEQKNITKTKRQVVRKQIALAILNKTAAEISEHRFWVKESEIKNYSKNKIINLEPVSLAENLSIRVVWWNSFNSVYEVSGDTNKIIIANKYPLPSKSIPDPKQRSAREYTD